LCHARGARIVSLLPCHDPIDSAGHASPGACMISRASSMTATGAGDVSPRNATLSAQHAAVSRGSGVKEGIVADGDAAISPRWLGEPARSSAKPRSNATRLTHTGRGDQERSVSRCEPPQPATLEKLHSIGQIVRCSTDPILRPGPGFFFEPCHGDPDEIGREVHRAHLRMRRFSLVGNTSPAAVHQRDSARSPTAAVNLGNGALVLRLTAGNDHCGPSPQLITAVDLSTGRKQIRVQPSL